MSTNKMSAAERIAAYPYSVYLIKVPGSGKRVWVIVREETEEIVRGSFNEHADAVDVCEALNRSLG